MIPEDYVPDLAVRMALYRRLNDAEDQAEIESLSAEMIDRFGPLPEPTANLFRLIEIKRQAIEAHVAKIDVGPRGALVSFHKDNFPNPAGLIEYAAKREGTIKLRPDSKLMVNRSWRDTKSRLNGLFQLTRGLSAIARKAA
jgi:transcription-repair coupling factor (superfamily II helicase)